METYQPSGACLHHPYGITFSRLAFAVETFFIANLRSGVTVASMCNEAKRMSDRLELNYRNPAACKTCSPDPKSKADPTLTITP